MPASKLADLSFDELMQTKVSTVYAASKHEESTRLAPAAVTIVTSADIEQYGYRTLAEVLRGVSGFYVTYDRVYSAIGVRGVNRPGDFGGRVLITVDGHRINEPVFDQAFNGTEFPLDVDLIDRVEVIRGPGSALYGNNAFFTIINVITRTGADVQPVELSGSAASFDTYTGRASLGHRFANGAELLLSGTYLDSAGQSRLTYPEFAQVNGGVAEHLDGQRVAQGFLRLSYGDFTLEGLIGDRRKDIPAAPYPDTVFNHAPNLAIDERAFAEFRWRHEFPGEWQASARLYFDFYQFDGVTPVTGPLAPSRVILNQDLNRAQWWGVEAQVSRTFGARHDLALGVEFRQDLELRQRNRDVDPPLVVSDVNTPGHDVGLYFQDTFSVRTNLTLVAGLRYDWFSTFGDTVNPRASVIYSPWRPTTFKVLYGQAYRAPNAYEFDYVAEGYANNHELQPETIRTGELVWEQDLSRQFRLHTSLFYSQIQNLITQEQDPVTADYRFFNSSEVDVGGVEVELQAHWPGGLRGHVSYTCAQALDQETHADLANSPRHLAILGVVAPLFREKLFASFELQGMSSRDTVRGGSVDGFVVANATVFSRELLKGLELSLSVYNLFDANYADPAGPDFTQDAIPQNGRSFRVKLTYRF
jgi:iron complex outermembrane receptor protein